MIRHFVSFVFFFLSVLQFLFFWVFFFFNGRLYGILGPNKNEMEKAYNELTSKNLFVGYQCFMEQRGCYLHTCWGRVYAKRS